MKSRTVRWLGHVIIEGVMRHMYRVFFGNHERKVSLGRHSP
jgi:hypothetical protein